MLTDLQKKMDRVTAVEQMTIPAQLSRLAPEVRAKDALAFPSSFPFRYHRASQSVTLDYAHVLLIAQLHERFQSIHHIVNR